MSRIVEAIWLVFCSSRLTTSNLCCKDASAVCIFMHTKLSNASYKVKWYTLRNCYKNWMKTASCRSMRIKFHKEDISNKDPILASMYMYVLLLTLYSVHTSKLPLSFWCQQYCFHATTAGNHTTIPLTKLAPSLWWGSFIQAKLRSQAAYALRWRGE